MNRATKLQSVEKTLLKFEHTKRMQSQKAWDDQKAEEEFVRKLL
jgi:hypothetical protein